jgi:hypothetical protein
MKSVLATCLALCGVLSAQAQTADSPVPDSTGITSKLSVQRDQRRDGLTPNGTTVLSELLSSGQHWNASAAVQVQTFAHGGTHTRAWFNELALNQDAGSWQFSAGKKIVAWDVGYGFRPNDMVQREERRTLISGSTEGRPVLMAEHFDADTAWSLVLVNPSKARNETGPQEPALAARVYQRSGALDLHAFARHGAHTGNSLGLAGAWVASDALELHGSVRAMTRSEAAAGTQYQALVGATWTHETQLSVLAEGWHDGNSNVHIPADNLYLRISWEHEGWQPSLDVLYQPRDGGRMATAGLLVKGDHSQVQAAWRVSGGPTGAALTHVPTRQQFSVKVSWAF